MSLEQKVCPHDIIQRVFKNDDDAIRVFMAGGSITIDSVRLKDGDSSVLADIELDVSKNALFVQSESLNQEATQLLIKAALDQLKFIGDDLKVTLDGETITIAQPVAVTQSGSWTVNVGNFPTDFPDAGTHTRLDTANGYLAGISAWDYATETTLLTRATEATQLLVKGVLDTIKTTLDSIHTRLADGTQQTKITDGTNVVAVIWDAIGSVWRFAVDAKITNTTPISVVVSPSSGYMFSSSEDNISSGGSGSDNPLFLMRNPAGSGKKARPLKMLFGIFKANEYAKFNVYKNPTVTANGTALSVVKLDSTGPAAVILTSKQPTVSAFGSRIACQVNQQNNNSMDLGFEKGLVLNAGESLLVTCDPKDNNIPIVITSLWEEV